MRAGRYLDIQRLMPAKIREDGVAGIRIRAFFQAGRALVQDGPQAREPTAR
jgi:hypothetical protein